MTYMDKSFGEGMKQAWVSTPKRAHKNTQSIGSRITLMSMPPTQVHNMTIAHGMASITNKTKAFTKTKLQQRDMNKKQEINEKNAINKNC